MCPFVSAHVRRRELSCRKTSESGDRIDGPVGHPEAGRVHHEAQGHRFVGELASLKVREDVHTEEGFGLMQDGFVSPCWALSNRGQQKELDQTPRQASSWTTGALGCILLEVAMGNVSYGVFSRIMLV